MESAARKLTVVSDTSGAKPKAKAKSQQSSDRRPAVGLANAKRRCEVLSYFVGFGCLVGLGLSGIDSALAVEKFMHQPMWRASMLAIVIDGLMVTAELTTLLTRCPKARAYATYYIYGAGGLSILLNAAEFASCADGFGHAVMNSVVGGLIPLLVLVSSKYAGLLYLSSK